MDILALMSFYRSVLTGWRKQDGVEESLSARITYGTPQAAYRKIFAENNVNGRPNLPWINVWSPTPSRNMGEYVNPFVRLRLPVGFSSSPDKRSLEYSPQWHEVPLQWSLWASDIPEANDILHQIYWQNRGQNDLFVFYNPDPVTDPEGERCVHHRMDEVTDDTEIEPAGDANSRSVVRYSWTGTILNAQLPMPAQERYMIKFIQLSDKHLPADEQPNTTGTLRYTAISPPGTPPDDIIIEVEPVT